MPKVLKPTLKQRRFVKEYVKVGNATEAAARVYDVKNRIVANNIGAENLAKPSVQQLLKSQASVAMLDQIEIREELKESKKDYAVRCKVNIDILDRAGFKPKESPQFVGNLTINWTDESKVYNNPVLSENMGETASQLNEEMDSYSGTP